MIRLDNVSKFYYTKGVIGVGFSKVSLNFDVGEFVAITGESGSGKSTLLNVISGLDSYEEGEMYINGEETSHYTEKDFEDYRRKYIGNIFQTFNLINSYTVYQNIELVMLLNGSKRSEVKPRVNELIEKVGLKEFKNTKAAKLSGGQKQRVAIARALAKDTPIIIADEPTGNLDSESAAEIIKLLASISKEKLVVIVTHNYDQVEPYVTRKIKMHDGKVLEDTKFDRPDRDIEALKDKDFAVSYKNIRPLSEIRLGVRNAFNIPVKFLLCTFVFLFITFALTYELGIFQASQYEEDLTGYNYYFTNTSENRIILKKFDENNEAQPFTSSDLKTIESLDNIDTVVEQDLYIDTAIQLSDKDYTHYLYGYVADMDIYKYGEPDIGRLPNADNEILILTTEDNYYLPSNEKDIEEYMSVDLFRSNISTYEENDTKFRVVGIKYVDADDAPMLMNHEMIFYFSSVEMKNILAETNQSNGTMSVTFQDKTYDPSETWPMYNIRTSESVEVGTCWVSDDYNYLVKNGWSVGETITIDFKNVYYSKSLELNISSIYYEGSFTQAYILPDGYAFTDMKGVILVNPEDLASLYDEPSYQVSVFVEDAHEIDTTIASLQNAGFDTLAMKDVLYDIGSGAILNLLTKGMIASLAVVLLIVAYFVIRIILKSRNFYYSTIRMLGANVSTARGLIVIDLLTDANIAYFVVIGAFKLLVLKFPQVYIINAVATYLTFSQFAAIYIIVILIALIVGIRYSRKLFKKSTMKTIKEEV